MGTPHSNAELQQVIYNNKHQCTKWHVFYAEKRPSTCVILACVCCTRERIIHTYTQGGNDFSSHFLTENVPLIYSTFSNEENFQRHTHIQSR